MVAALACPICFPKLAIIGAVVGLGAFAPYEGYVAIAIQTLFVLALLGQISAYQVHRNARLLGLVILTTAVLFVGYYVIPSGVLLQSALAGLVIASVWQVIEMRRCAQCGPKAKT